MKGGISKRGNTWVVRIYQGRDPLTHRKKYLWRTAITKKEAESLRIQLLYQQEQGMLPMSGKTSVETFLDRWLEDYARPNTSPKTFRQYSDLIRTHIKPALGKIQLSRLGPQHLQSFYREALQHGRMDNKGGLAPKTVLHLHRLLHLALGYSIRWGLLAKNPAEAASPPRVEHYVPPILTRDQVRGLLEQAALTRHGAIIHTAIMTGLRRGELLGLRWQDLDLEGGTAYIRQSLQWLSREGFSFRQPKTSGSRRSVALAPSSIRVLKEHRARQLEERLLLGSAYKDNDLVFCNVVGTPINPGNLRRDWVKIARSASLTGLRFHDLRHVHASLLLIEGVHPKIVSERLGHSDVRITLNTYSHVLPGLQEQAAARLDRFLASG